MSLNQSIEPQDISDKIIGSFPEVEHIFSPIGTSEIATDPTGVNLPDTYASISRQQTIRRAAVMINPHGRDTKSFVDEAMKKIEKEVQLPPGSLKNLQEGRSWLQPLTPLTLLLVLVMIYAALQNIIETVLVFACGPMELVGGVLGLTLNRLPFSSSVLMTALGDIFGFLPIMLSSNVGAEVQKPLAFVVIGGVLSSAVLTMLILPMLYQSIDTRINQTTKGVL